MTSNNTDQATPLRVMFFVDGFNLYHSVRHGEKDLKGKGMKWLDLASLCRSFLYIIDTTATLESVHYFTAYAEHLNMENPEKVNRHKSFVRALTADKKNNMAVHRGIFRKRSVWREESKKRDFTYEEKETDVALACEVLSEATKENLDVAIIISGDSDFVPLVKTFNDLFPDKQIRFAFPYERVSRELKKLCPKSFIISKEAYAKHQFSDRVKLPSGKYVSKPETWK